MAMTTMITMRTTSLVSTSRLDPMVMETPLELFSLSIRSRDFETFFIYVMNYGSLL
jgi:hypothetical protein